MATLHFSTTSPGPYFVLEQFGQIAACGGWALDTAGVADLTWGMVRRKFHRRGLGRELLRFRLNAIRNDGRATLVRVRTVARAFQLTRIKVESAEKSASPRRAE